MTIITLKNIVTGTKTRIQSIIEPLVNIDSNWNSRVTPIVKWIDAETGDDVPKELLELLRRPKLYQVVSKNVLIYKIE
ncbi:hypothetical protein F993_01564 [Acinetobacter proteolyticus]|jgi:hypothetical protein|uniref:Uncharacterized protein n=1 Tax=Acinetobacter proteolyticus TaxID=1776741 RepID=A0A653K964_9GAMM|nr:hypothetical protein [Acinetobacter proteolyticus]ENU23411.1 hypothetical protein F993_01564 [Acinetobacter proteolyticus]OEY95104.1 hypothetical protein BJD20_17080 [Acinetobacter proteolyticus]PKF33364.1 hypothetical protein CW311_11185 [Acinetobacter proteolyticus]WEI17837.1 hypothetical protein PY247_15970 [Acinetobacter proteolyticus]VXA57498.1 conserved hypothetical protein [Acinetobacter proteolyticus]